MESDKIKIQLHAKQGAAFNSEFRETLCAAGLQGGKTTVGSLWSLKQTAKWSGEGNNAIIGAPTYKILNQSTLPTFLRWAHGAGTYYQTKSEFKFHNGLNVFIRTSTDPDSIEGIQNVRWAWLDEAGKCKRQFYINVQGRCARTAAPIFYTTTPYGMNWPFQEIIKPYKEGLRPDVGFFNWKSVENPSFPKEEYERQRRLLDPRVFRRRYDGLHERMEGLVYELTQDHYCDPIVLPKYTRVFAAVDFGFTEGHEFAFLARAITGDGFRYEIDEYKKTGLDPTEQIQLLKSKQQAFRIEKFLCDPSRPDMIALMNKNGLRASGFHIGNENFKEVVPGVNKHIELIRSGFYKIFRGNCPELEDEYETYHWPEYDEEKFVKEAPVKLNDDMMDAARMLTIGTMHIKLKQDAPMFLPRQPTIDTFDPVKGYKKQRSSWDSY